MMRNFLGKLLSGRLFHHPIFIVGDGRSGTSILLQALGRHRRILDSPGEAPLLTTMGGTVGLFEFSEEATSRYYNESLPMPKAYLYDQLRKLSFEIAFGADHGLRFLAKQFLRRPSEFLKKKCWAAKTFPPEIVAKGLKLLFPDAKILYILRNGIDVVHSKTKFHGFRNNDFRDHCSRWKMCVERFEYLEKCDYAMALRHEELVSNPEIFFMNVFTFLGIEHDDKPISFAMSNLVHPLDESTKTGVKVNEMLATRKSPCESWSSEQKDIFKELCAEAMLRKGYDLSF